MRFAKWVFLLSGVYGLIVITPMYFLEGAISRNSVPITHPENFYGFVGAAFAFQILFLTISRDPRRYRPAMIAAVLEKATFGIAVSALFAQGRAATPVMVFASIDMLWGVLFAVSWFLTAPGRDA